MSKTRVNYKSDLPPIAVTFKLGQLSIDVPTHDFVVRFFVEGAPGKSFICSYLDGTYKNCEKTSSSVLTCYIDNHGFQCGRLCCEYVSLDRGAETGGKYADGIYKVVTPSRLDIILVDGPSDTATTVVADASVDLSEIISDIEGLQSDVRDALIALDGKLDYYDASWAATEGTSEDFAALMSAVLAGTPILYAGVLVNALRHTSSRITLTYDNGKYVNVVDIVKDGDDINISNDITTLATAGDLSTVSSAVTSLGSRVTTAEGNITSLGNRLTTAEGSITSIQNDLTGSGTTIPRFHSASWLETEEGVYDQSHPERRASVRYTSMLEAITGERKLIKLKNITATGVETGEGWISLSFVSTDTTGKTSNVVYIVRYTSGAAYCTVEKKVTEIPFYDATWVLGYGTRDQMDELIKVTQGTPKDIIMLDKSPVLWAARRSNDVVQLSIMQSENTIRVYTIEYSSGSGETRSTYSEFEIQEVLVSGTNIKTVNNQSLLGSGNITIQGGGGGGNASFYDASWITVSVQKTEANYNALVAAITNGDLIFYNGHSTYATKNNTTITLHYIEESNEALYYRARVIDYSGGSFNEVADSMDLSQLALTDDLAGLYEKPSGGIPSTDMTSAVQTSLGKADTALQSHQDISGKANKRTVVSSGSALTADTYLELGTTDTVAPTLPATYTDADEFIFSFTCNTAACSVTLPTGVVLADNCDNFSEVAAGVFFQVSIMDDVAAYLCVTPTT